MTAPAAPRSPFLERLEEPRVIVGDGAMGTMLYSRGVPANACFDECNLTQSRLVLDIHEAYIQAGAEMIETNTYGANRFKLGTYDLGEKVRAVNARGPPSWPSMPARSPACRCLSPARWGRSACRCSRWAASR